MDAVQQHGVQEASTAGIVACRGAPEGDSDRRPYWLASKIHPCFTEDYALVLDLRRDRYLAFDGFEASVLATWVRGWPGLAGNESEIEGVFSAAEILAGLVSEGVLVPASEMGKSVRPATVAEPLISLLPCGVARRPSTMTLSVVVAFIQAMTTAKVRFGFQSLERVVDFVALRRARAAITGTRGEITEARELVHAFTYLRPLLFASPNACLLNALALLNLLSQHGWFPSWVFGVQTNPFSAHCWLQEGSVVVNDRPERVTGYTPILVV